MRFRPLAPRTLRWRPVEGEGLEHLDLRPVTGGIMASAAVIGERGGVPYGARYLILCDESWRVVEFGVSGTDGRGLLMRSPEPGRWLDSQNRPLPAFDGCLDIDLAATPFTNTLPIRRLGLGPDQGTVELAMVYVPFDSLEPLVDRQRYTALRDGELYRYEAADRSFTADLPLDADGLVLDYPGLFRRV
ncbi:transcriptional regulator [Aureimonas endophytica]|uniref:Transcriptional regulator n=1 Tax=Aureimonas endophytica TaxID=2027858 RepID=A0A916ZFI9_9HYPH|nr:putative glycolipid-binding domain-containing protein [Aureimonas endophytica]GGD94546.1 transcriptional regulator [Aureimonas endophytica]